MKRRCLALLLVALVVAVGCASMPTQLELRSAASETKNGLFAVTGSVRNVSGYTLEGVQAVITLLDSNGKAQASYAQPVEHRILLNKQTAQFRAATKFNPGLTRYRIAFTDSQGHALPHVDAISK